MGSRGPFGVPMENIRAFDILLQEIEEKIKRLEQERKRLAYLENFFYDTDAAIIATDITGHIRFFSRGAESLTGYEGREVENKHISMLLRDGYKNFHSLSQSHEIHIVGKNGSIRSVHAFVSKDDDGALIICMPVEGWTEMDNLIAKNSLFGVYVLQDGKIAYVNSKIEETLGYGREEMLGKPFLKFVHPEDNGIVRKRYTAGKHEKMQPRYEVRVITKEGKTRYMDMMEISIRRGGRKVVLGNAVDITEGRKAEEALYNSERKYRQVVENAVEGIYRITADGKFLEGNISFIDMFGYDSLEEISGENAWNLYEQHEDAKQFLDAIRKNGKVKNCEMKGMRKDGRTIITTQSAVLVNTGDGEVIEGIIQDVTARKRAEAEAEFYNSLLRHDLGNKIQIIMGYLGLLTGYDLPERERGLLEKASNTLRTGSDLIEKIRYLHQVNEETRLKSTNLDKIVKKVVKDYMTEGERRGLSITYDGDAKVKVKTGVLTEEVVANVLENSIKHSHATKIEIYAIEKGGLAGICIEDNGVGIPDEMKKDIFKRRFKGKGSGGSGMGLYLVKKIVEKYGGRVEAADGGEKGGTRFNIYFRKG